MDFVQGENLDDLMDVNRLRGLDTLTHIQQLSVVKALAKLKVFLSKPVPFNKLGSIIADSAGRGPSVGPLITLTQSCIGEPFESAHELWRSCLKHEMLHAVQEWCNLEEDQRSTLGVALRAKMHSPNIRRTLSTALFAYPTLQNTTSV